ncbi:hypothetical protein ACIRVF_42225 [Kitasatospora sp. NPDC101157]|uniref:hypothetical protein n=1 Tax=Kitasatospora sp. NPDC101157 TaxID=3364098 RepID=UPI0037FDA8ED
MHDQHHRTDRPAHQPEPQASTRSPAPPAGPPEPADGGQALWDATVAALAAADIDIVQAGDGRPGAVLELGPRGLGVAVRWQPTDQHLWPGGVLSVSACRGDGPVPARKIRNVILESHLTDAGLRTAYADGHLVVVHPDLVLPGQQPRREGTAALEALDRPAAPAQRARRRRWPAHWLRRCTGR